VSISDLTRSRPRLAHPIKTVRIHAGQGDVLMAVTGLQALLELGAEFLAQDACIYTRTDTASLVKTLLPEFKVDALPNSRSAPHPRYVIVQHLSWTTVLRNWLTRDFYVNFPERRLLASYGYPRPGLARRAQLFFTDLKFRAALDWQREAPTYYAIKMWAPLARALGLNEIDLARGLYQAHQTLRARLLTYTVAQASKTVPAVAFFPSGRGFQYVPAAFIRELVARARIADYACYFGPKDPTIADYRAAGLECRTTANVNELLHVVASAAITATSDSFVSHVAQLLARNHVALMSHDIPMHTINPAAPSRVVFSPLPCSPCYYTIREPGGRCAAGLEACGVFALAEYLDKAVTAFDDLARP
jgi:hypothetical protein